MSQLLVRIGIGLAILGGIVLTAILVCYLIQSLRMMWLTHRIFRRKAQVDTVVSAVVEPWPDPISRKELLLQTGTDKIIWGYWQQGEDKLPGFCKMAVQSWKLRHPDWKIIILSEETFRTYVAHTDLPSTFDSLKIQIRSDIVRSAVLQRYGGVYMDSSYVVLKAFDDLWDKAKENNDMYLTALWTLKSPQGKDMVVPNICLIVAPHPNNPVLAAWHESLLQYFECPAFTVPDMKEHPVLKPVAPLLDDPSLWICKNFSPYLASLWLLCKVFYYEPSVQPFIRNGHVKILPTLLWTFDQIMASLFYMSESEVYETQIRRESCLVWMKRGPPCIKLNFGNDARAAAKFVDLVGAVKASTDLCLNFDAPPEYHLSRKTTQARIWRAALDVNRKTRQATTRGSFCVVPLNSEVKGDDSEIVWEKRELAKQLKPMVSSLDSDGDVELSSQTSLSYGDSSGSGRSTPPLAVAISV